MIDTNNITDLLKLKLYHEWIYSTHIYSEGESRYHKDLTEQMVKTYVDPLNLDKDAKILDLGCGAGYFLDQMKLRGYTNCIGITLSDPDVKHCISKGHTIKKYDFSFLPKKDGFHDESVDFIFARHALEHSPYPIFSLIEFNRILKGGGKIYIEVPQPNCERNHEFNLNHYSILGHNQLNALLKRTGFQIDHFNNLDFDLKLEAEIDGKKEFKEKYYCIVATKKMALDIK